MSTKHFCGLTSCAAVSGSYVLIFILAHRPRVFVLTEEGTTTCMQLIQAGGTLLIHAKQEESKHGAHDMLRPFGKWNSSMQGIVAHSDMDAARISIMG